MRATPRQLDGAAVRNRPLSRTNGSATHPSPRLYRALHSHPRRQAPSRAGWVHEIKHDGYRLIVRWDGAAVRLPDMRGLLSGSPSSQRRSPPAAARADRAFGIGAEPGHHEHRSPSTSVPTRRAGDGRPSADRGRDLCRSRGSIHRAMACRQSAPHRSLATTASHGQRRAVRSSGLQRPSLWSDSDSKFEVE
jgi:hypothetical protein